jgi:N-methylhydantoinase B
VAADVRNGFVSLESARDQYGVVLAADGRSLDGEATAKHRARRPPAKLFHRHGYCDVLA